MAADVFVFAKVMVFAMGCAGSYVDGRFVDEIEKLLPPLQRGLSETFLQAVVLLQ